MVSLYLSHESFPKPLVLSLVASLRTELGVAGFEPVLTSGERDSNPSASIPRAAAVLVFVSPAYCMQPSSKREVELAVSSACPVGRFYPCGRCTTTTTTTTTTTHHSSSSPPSPLTPFAQAQRCWSPFCCPASRGH